MSDTKHPATEEPAPTEEVALDEGEIAALKKQKKQRLIALAVVVILALSAIGGTVVWWKKTRAAAHKDKKPSATASTHAEDEEDDENPPIFMPIERIVVKLHRTTPTSVEHYLQVAMELKLGNNKVNEKIKQYQPIIQHEIMLILSSKEAEWLDSVENKKALAVEVRNKINKIIKAESPKEGVKAVYFSSFILQ